MNSPHCVQRLYVLINSNIKLVVFMFTFVAMAVEFNLGFVFGYGCLLLFTFCLIIYVKIFRRDPRLVAFANTVPGPPSVPIIGHGFDFFWSGMEGVEKMLGYSEKYGTLYRLWFGKHLTLVMSNVEDLETVFLSSKMLDKPDMCESFHEMFGDSVFNVTGQTWRKQRKQLQPLYTKKALPFYEESTNRLIREYVKRISEQHLDGAEFDLWHSLPFLIFDITTKTQFDVEFSLEEKNNLKYHLCIKKMVESMFLQAFRPWLHVKLLRRFYNWREGVFSAREQAYKYANEITKRKLPSLEETLITLDVTNIEESEEISSQFPFLLATYPLQREYNDTKRLFDEIVVITAAATDTTSITLSSVLLMAAMHPEVQKLLCKEMYQVFGDDDREATIDDLQRLPYLDSVLKETQRLLTPLPLIFRKVQEDCKIGEMNVPAGTTLVVSAIGIHKNPEYYEDPLSFNPNRFAPEEVEKRPKLAYLSFSAGSRNCLGLNFAVFMVKLAVITFLRTFKLETSMKLENVKLAVGFISISLNGYKVRVTRRRSLIDDATKSSMDNLD